MWLFWHPCPDLHAIFGFLSAAHAHPNSTYQMSRCHQFVAGLKSLLWQTFSLVFLILVYSKQRSPTEVGLLLWSPGVAMADLADVFTECQALL